MHVSCPTCLSVSHAAICKDIAYCGLLLWHLGERPFAGMRHAQIIYHVTTLLAHPEFPKGTPPKFKVRLQQLEYPLYNITLYVTLDTGVSHVVCCNGEQSICSNVCFATQA